MTNEHPEQTANWSEGEYYFMIAISTLIVIVLTLIFTTMTRVYKKFSKAIKANVYGIIVILTVMCRAINFLLISTEIISPFGELCYNESINGCFRCNFSDRFDVFLLLTHIATKILVFIQALQINFQRFPLLAYPHMFIYGWETVCILVWIVSITLYFIKLSTNHGAYSLASNHSIHICYQGLDDETEDFIMSVISPFCLSSHILLCVLFIVKARKLYQFTKSTIKSPDPEKIKRGLRSLKLIIKTMIRHTTLVLCLTGSMIFLLVIPAIVNPDINLVSLEAVDGLIASLCIYMMYPFGKGLFRLIFGGCNKRILRKWYEYEYKATFDRNIQLASANDKVTPPTDDASSTSYKYTKSGDTNSISHKSKKSKTGSNTNSNELVQPQFDSLDKVKKKNQLPDLSMIVEEDDYSARGTSITGQAADCEQEWSSMALPSISEVNI